MVRMNGKETLFVSLNAALLAIFYTLLGVLVSYILYYLFDEYNEEWQKKSMWYKFFDVSLEISLLSIISFWSGQLIEVYPPIFPVRKQLDTLVDGYISGIFYIFAIFIFMDSLTEKLKHLYEDAVGPHFNKIFPQHGSLLDLSLSYTPLVKTEKSKHP